ncbi:MAG: hypothetical protein H7144_03330 [Burkholderiales bacterium]|nr:hypothetical protein [Phycisphaerae bacterium]
MLLNQIMLATDSDPTLKIIIGVIFAGIWVVAQLASALGKKKDKTPEADYPIPMPDHLPPQPPPRRPPPLSKRQEDYPQRQVDTDQTSTQSRQRPSAERQKKKVVVVREPSVVIPRQPPRQKASPPQRRYQPQSQTLQSPARAPAVPTPTARGSMTSESAFEESTFRPAIRNLQPAVPRRATDVPIKAQSLRAQLVPANLRTQYVLTEILRPPLALRDETADPWRPQ